MKYLKKIIYVIKNDGLLYLLEFSVKKIYIKISNIIFWKKNRRLIENATSKKNVIIITKTIEWNYAFQRTQQLALQFSKKADFCVIYITEPTVHYDCFININKINDNLYCYSYRHYKLLDVLLKESKCKILYVTNLLNYDNDVCISYDKMVYEYIDELSLWFKDDIELGLSKHLLAIETADVVVATAVKLFNEVNRLTNKAILCENAGDYDFFIQTNNYEYDDKIVEISSQYDCVLGYYGMLADWFDYDLIKNVAENNSNWAWVLIGPVYPNYNLSQHHLEQYNNIYVLGPKPYKKLPSYVRGMNILTIPFKLNEITASTSPVKLFEYMAADKPIITSNMEECRRYESVKIYDSIEHFENLVKSIINMSSSDKARYHKLLNKNAKDNTWEKRADVIIKSLNL